jgi:hypothetical protein
MWIASKTNKPLAIGGLNAPLFAETEITSAATGMEDSALSTLTGLEAGITFKDATALIKAGANEYAATMKYYNTAYDITVTVTGTALARNNVILKNADGSIYKTVDLKANQDYALEVKNSTGKLFLGWLGEDGKLYNAGYAIDGAALDGDVTYTLVEIGFALEAGASVRYVNDDNGQGGLRFSVIIDAADYAIAKDFLTGFSSIIAPTDTIVENGAIKDSAYTTYAKELDITNLIPGAYEMQVAFAITDIAFSNFNREFSATAFFTVNYDGSNDTRVVKAAYSDANSVSVYEVAAALLGEHYADLYSDEGSKEGTLSSREVYFLEAYVDQTVDVVIENEEVAITELDNGIDYRKADGDGITAADIPYTVVGEVDGNTVTLTVTFDEDNALGTKFSKKNDSTDKYQVPVIVRINGKAYRLSNAADAVVKVVSCEYDETTRVATIVFTLNA